MAEPSSGFLGDKRGSEIIRLYCINQYLIVSTRRYSPERCGVLRCSPFSRDAQVHLVSDPSSEAGWLPALGQPDGLCLSVYHRETLMQGWEKGFAEKL